MLPGMGDGSGLAHESPDGQYRYELSRRWGPEPPLGFVMLNPSTANAFDDDPTIRRCLGFARREGAGGIWVVNLFAYRATDPAHLWAAGAPTGGDTNDGAWRRLFERCDTVVAAWGAATHSAVRPQVDRLVDTAGRAGRSLWCLGVTKSGAPSHPLYLRADRPLTSWPSG